MVKPHKKLTPDKIVEIRRLAAERESQRKIAAQFGITQGHAHQIINRMIWKKIP